MAVTILSRRQPFRGLRRLNPYRDLRQVTALIAETFGADLDAEGRAALRDMRVLGWLGPLVAFVLVADPQLQRMLQGYVWIEEGRVVGNLSLQSGLRYGERWHISNVAVAPAYRGRGIARALVEAALEEVEREGGGWATLQVEAENEAACRLYAGLGFEALGGMACLHLAKPPATPPPTTPIPSLRPWRADDWHGEYELARTVIPALLQWWQPLRSEAFRRYAEDWLGEAFNRLIGRQRTYHWVVEAGAGLRPAHQGRLAASLWLRAAGWRGEHRLRLMVHPEARGALEEPLLRQALAVLSACPPRPTVAQHPAGDQQAIEAFLTHGFLLRRTLVAMRKRIR
ncbi:MAG: GNAT family N-acetyltransferase [Anaerolineae bacterium]|nr:GNAT family N-acetyltransferase [Anaerolineae bacterium]